MGHYHENYPLCADLVISTLGAANYSKPMDSAAFIYGAINSVAAFVAANRLSRLAYSRDDTGLPSRGWAKSRQDFFRASDALPR
jgi:hypothetical protein